MVAQKLPPEPNRLRVAICGGGPAGLGAAIALSALPNVEVTIYEQARQLREIGAGIRIGYNCWRVLALMGAAQHVKGHIKTTVLHRNGLNGEILDTRSSSMPVQYKPRRVRRTRLQSALIKQVAPGTIKLNKRLVAVKNLPQGGVSLAFEDGFETTVDLVVGADGIRSVVRDSIFPDHSIRFTGTTIWRTLIPISAVAHQPDLNSLTSWWYGPAGHVYLSPVDDPEELDESERMFEISCRNLVDPETASGKRFSWGIPATNQRVQSHFTEYDPRVRDVLSRVPEGQWKEFSAFAGPRLAKLHAWDKVVLLGDASHPLSGAFGSGAAFALEDGWILARAIEYTRDTPKGLAHALEIFDAIRSPYYLRMYQYLDEQRKKAKEALANATDKSFESVLKIKMASSGSEEGLPWIYHNDIEDVWEKYLETQINNL
ncbi:uncharacterized protein Z520_10199 [Fonsecaea multimorphosa CBS 102226]|uniref:FAD-binding domain-containing protein n=1 Tax=Fonsecaea multimorphosa CBS 102226 TaxID=1442371 RepID=A0A0D2KBU9_9EURO|nr:uncharacterized protein Z520_10199 [Fonsecaea multimorphosa CBS 102226]KIX94173.1 hypothetical protein Z520_10199 [Fonsecaea multimorphosa CBS 102226]